MKIYCIGIGPGGEEQMTLRAVRALEACDCVAGYGLYLDLIDSLIEGKERIQTGMTRAVVDEKGDQLVNQIALHRLGQPDDVACAVAFLASDAASYLTGTFVEISGGKLCVQNPDYGYKKLEKENG